MRCIMRGLILSMFLVLSAVAGPEKGALHLKRVACFDNQMGGAEAFSMLIPAEWYFDCRVDWNVQNVTVRYVLKTQSPDGSRVMEVMPTQTFQWFITPVQQQQFPAGSVYFGSYMYPPLSAIEYIKQVFIPQYRSNVADFRIKAVEPVPILRERLSRQMAASATVAADIDADVIKVSASYSENGVQKDEIILLGITYVQSNSFIVWEVLINKAVTTRKGDMNRAEPLMNTITDSFTENPIWRAKVNRLRQLYVQRQLQNIHNIGELSRRYSQMSNQIADEQMKAYKRKDAVNDALAERYSRSLRGVEQYNNPIEEQTVELPSGYGQVWTDGDEYILSNDPNYNPAEHDNKKWTRMKKIP